MSNVALFIASVLATLAWLVPNHYPPWLSFHGEVLMAAALCLAFFGEAFKHERVYVAKVTAATCIVGLIPLVQALLGLLPFAGDAWVVSLYIFGFAFAQILGCLLAQRIGVERTLYRAAYIFVAAALASVGLQLYQWLRLDGLGIYAADMPFGGTPFANLAQPNHLATLLFLGLVGTLFLYESSVIRGWATGLSAAFLQAGMVMTGSRTAWVTMLALVTVLTWWKTRGILRLPFWTIGVIGAVMLALIVMWAPTNEFLFLSPGRSFSDQANIGPRPLFYATMIDAVHLRPWGGFGWNQGLAAQDLVVELHPAGGRLMGSGHNLFLDLIVWNGMPIGLALIGLLLAYFFNAFRAVGTAGQIFAVTALLGVFTHAMFEFPLSYTYFLLPVGFLIGVFAHSLGECKHAVSTSFTKTAAISLAIPLMLLAVDYQRVESNVRILRFETARIGAHEIKSQPPSLLILTQWQAYLEAIRVAPRSGLSADDLKNIGVTATRFPYVSLQFNYALAAALNGDSRLATSVLIKLCSLHGARICSRILGDWERVKAVQYPQLESPQIPKSLQSHVDPSSKISLPHSLPADDNNTR